MCRWRGCCPIGTWSKGGRLSPPTARGRTCRPDGRVGWERAYLDQGERPSANEVAGDTTYLTVMDRRGTIFSSTPSGGGDFVPTLGVAVSHRGRQSWIEQGHPSAIAAHKRPRLTPNPALVLRDGHPMMGIGTPGGDTQVQAMFQTLLNLLVTGWTRRPRWRHPVS